MKDGGAALAAWVLHQAARVGKGGWPKLIAPREPMDCPTCSKPYPDDLTECPHCAAAAVRQKSDPMNYGYGGNLEKWWDVAPEDGSGSTPQPKQQPKEKKPDDESGNWAELLKSSADNVQPASDNAAQHAQTVGSQGEKSKTKGFVLPSAATISHTPKRHPVHDGNPTAPRAKSDKGSESSDDSWGKSTKPKESQVKAFGRSAEVQEAPLHDSWSSQGDGTPSVPRQASPDSLAARQPFFQDGWSSGGSSQEPESQKSSWAAALQAAASGESSDDEPIPGHEAPGPGAVVEAPVEAPAAAPGETFESLPPAIGEPKEKKGVAILLKLLTGLFVILAVGSLLAASHHFLTKEAAAPSASVSPGEDGPTDDATIWLNSAQESLDSKDFELAAPQLERAVDFLKKGDKKRLKETQILLAKTYNKVGDYSSSATLWTELAKTHPDLKKTGQTAAAAALRANRVIANKKVKQAEQAVKGKKYDQAIKVAKEALRIYQLSQGQNGQLARAHGVLGDAYREQQNTRVALSHFTKAYKLDPKGRYRAEMRKLKLPVRPTRVKPVKKVKPKFVTETDIPKAGARR